MEKETFVSISDSSEDEENVNELNENKRMKKFISVFILIRI
jgi:hypothetical protein